MKKINGRFYAVLAVFFAVLSLSLSGCAKKKGVTGQAKSKLSVGAFKTQYSIIPDYLKSPGNTDSLNNTAISAHGNVFFSYDPADRRINIFVIQIVPGFVQTCFSYVILH